MRRLVIAAIVVAGCRGSSDAPATPAAPACEPTLTAAQQRIARADAVGPAGGIGDRAWQTMIASCESEHWSAEALGCMASARLAIDLTTCTEKLTFEQHERLERKLAWLRGSPYASGGMAAGAGGAATVDAGIDAVRSSPPAPSDAAVVVDCRDEMRDPKNHECVAQFCRGHAADPFCALE
jgi:hypothetical protein